jgi:hypothetical protein
MMLYYLIEDKDAKVTYRANRDRDFNPFINASDKLEDFIRFCAANGVRTRAELMNMPIQLFIAWLVLEAAKADNEPAPENVTLIPDLRKRLSPRCNCCGKFLSLTLAQAQINLCSTACFERQIARAGGLVRWGKSHEGVRRIAHSNAS